MIAVVAAGTPCASSPCRRLGLSRFGAGAGVAPPVEESAGRALGHGGDRARVVDVEVGHEVVELLARDLLGLLGRGQAPAAASPARLGGPGATSIGSPAMVATA